MGNETKNNSTYFKDSIVRGAPAFAWGDFQSYKDLDEEAFMDYIKRYEGTSYYEQALNALNAYKSNTWSANAWQALGANLFGDVSPFLNFINTKNSTLTDAMSRIEDAFHQEKYNSAEEQTLRLRGAGLNPDLNGGVSPGNSGNVDNLELAQPALNDGFSVLPEVASQAMQAISLAMNLAKGFQDLSAGDISLMLGSIDLRDKSNESILDSLGNMLSERDIRILLDPYAENIDKKRLFSDNDRLTAQSNFHSAMQLIIGDNRLSNSLRRRLKRSFSTPYSGSINADSKLYKLLEDTYSHKKDAVLNAGHPFTRDGFESCLTKIGDHIQQTVLDIEKLNAKIVHKDAELQDKRLGVEGQQLQFESDRLSQKGPEGESLGELAGKSDASAYNSEVYKKEYDAIVNKMWDDIMKDLQYGQDKDKWWSKLLRFAIPIVRLWLGNINMPSLSHSTSSGIDSKGNPVLTRSTSFGF